MPAVNKDYLQTGYWKYRVLATHNQGVDDLTEVYQVHFKHQGTVLLSNQPFSTDLQAD